MSALTSLLVRDRVVPVSKIEEALQHQVLVGGDIETILLEMNLVPEDVLSAYRAALFGLLPATREEVMKATREALRKVPRELARGVGFVPLLIEGGTLVVAACEPPSAELSRQVKTQLGCELAVRIVTQLRLSAGLSHHYGYELDARLRRLTETLRKRDPGVIPYVRPPSPSMKPVTAERRKDLFGSNAPDTLERSGLPETPEVVGRFTLSEPADVRPRVAVAQSPVLPDAVETEHAKVEEVVAEIAAHKVVDDEPSRPRMSRPPHSTIPPSAVSSHIARGVRGPLSEERAVELLNETTQRDDVLFVVLRYVQQFFDFAAIFSVGKEGARGRMAHGGGLAPELMEQVVIPLDGSGIAARAVREKRPIVGDLSAVEEERAAAALLGRPAGRPGLIVPILLRSRAVLLVYGDRDAEGISLEDAQPLAPIATVTSEALRRLIVENKALNRNGPGISVRPPRPSAPPAPAEPVATPQLGSAGSERTGENGSTQPLAMSSRAPTMVQAPLPAPEPEPDAAARVPFESMAMLATASLRPSELGLPSLEAVDLETVSRPAGREQRRQQTVPLHPAVATGEPTEAKDAARARVKGVPRSAPPPPARESSSPPSLAGAGAYSYVAPTGSGSEEKVRTSRKQASVAARASVAQAAPAEVQAQPANVEAEPSVAEPNTRASGEQQPIARIRPSQVRMDPAPSVIIDMGDSITSLVEGLMLAQPSQEPREIGELLKIGEAALPVLLQHFPGPLWFDRRSAHKRRPRGRDVSALARGIVAFGDKAAPYLASALAANNLEVCYYALMVAGEVVHPDLLDPVARHALGNEEELRVVALEVLRSYADLPQFPMILRAIADLTTRAGKDARRQRLAVEALGELRDQRSLRTLLPRLSDASEAIVQAAHRALVTLTGQDFGLAQKKWEAWAEQWGAAHRVEWLIESLLHAEESVRALSGEELKQLTQQYFGYHPALPKRDRELAQRKYREWWENEGKHSFVPVL
jgi:hypothetical protein